MQSYIWIHSPFIEHIEINPLDFGDSLNDDGIIEPTFGNFPPIPEDFPAPCNCKKCSKPKVCPCRVKQILCCHFCKCNASSECRNKKT